MYQSLMFHNSSLHLHLGIDSHSLFLFCNLGSNILLIIIILLIITMILFLLMLLIIIILLLILLIIIIILVLVLLLIFQHLHHDCLKFSDCLLCLQVQFGDCPYICTLLTKSCIEKGHLSAMENP